ncbi:MAG: IS4 family transposase [Deltaproteobacteria bacterium]|nr:IS4 family transposase [Deltaproteobacteria bacterium]
MASIQKSLAATGGASKRNHRLPATSVVALIVAMGLMRNRSVVDLANDFRLVRTRPNENPIESNAISAARARLGEAPVAHLASTVGMQWAAEAADAQRWRGLAIFGIDGSTLRVADTPENRSHFGLPGHDPKRGAAAYPQAQIVALMALRTHLIAALAVGPCKHSELSLAPALLEQVPERSLTILDRNFLSARLLLQYARKGRERHWLLRAKSNTKWRVVRTFGPGDFLVEMIVTSEARKRAPELPAKWNARVIHYQRRGFRPQRLLTSLLDPERWPAHEFAALYHERWELELALDELKTEQLARKETLRSRAPWSVRQELWGVMLAYNLVRRRAERCALAEQVSTLQISFVCLLRQLQTRWVILAILGPSLAADMDAHEHRQRRRARLPTRRSTRHYPRAVKIKMSSYARKHSVVREAA